MKKSLLLSLLLFYVVFAHAGIDNLLPKPQYIKANSLHFVIDKLNLSTPVLGNEWNSFISEVNGELNNKSAKTIKVVLVENIPSAKYNQNEAYVLKVTSDSIYVEATTEKGVYYAIQTLRQLITKKGKKTYFEGCEILDYPAFRIRGFMHDVGRGYISMDELKREIVLLSQFKINTFHWHLTEDVAWRLESKIFPMINDSCNMVRLPGKYYTIDEAKELVEYCKKHQVLIIPEVDMPGHSAAFRKAFRHDMQSPEGMKILKLLMDEVCETFDVPYIHIGTDEVKFTNPDFVSEMVQYIRASGKKVISWNPGWNYKAGEIDMTHLWSYRGKAQAGIPAIDSKFHYINHFDTFADIVALYNSRIANQPNGNEDYAGSIIAVWNDRFVQSERNIILENAFYPTMLALAERTWLGGGTEYFDVNGTMLPAESTEVFKTFTDFERRMLWHKNNTLNGLPFPYVKQTNVKWRITDAFPNNGDLAKAFPPETAISTTYDFDGKAYTTQQTTGAGIYLRHVWGTFVPSFYKNPQPNHTAYAYTWVYSSKKQEVGLVAEFQNYGRSEMDLPPKQGTWDYKGSKIWLNDAEIQPPVWTAQHAVKSNETPLGNENWMAREPIQVSLNKGWNKVLLKLPVGQFTTPEVRLVKWMFTVVFVTPDGSNAVDNLIYSPDKKIK